MIEQYISFETAKLAKEKGYRIYCGISYWKKDGELFGTPYYEFPHDEERYTSYPRYFAPTQSLLQKWLREEHNIHISIYPIKSHWEMDVRDCDMSNDVHASPNQEYNKYQAYEEALEHGLIEALKLI